MKAYKATAAQRLLSCLLSYRRMHKGRNSPLRCMSVPAGPASPSYFAFFSTQKDAAFAAQTRIHPEDSHCFRVMEAPGPEEVILHFPLLTSERLHAHARCALHLI